MLNFKYGDVITRKSYGEDLDFKIVGMDTRNNGDKIYKLKGLMYRLEADATENDIIKKDIKSVCNYLNNQIKAVTMNKKVTRNFPMFYFLNLIRVRNGLVLHLDGDEDFLRRSLEFYKISGIQSIGRIVSEKRQPEVVGNLVKRFRPDILVLTGHDGIKKGHSNINSIESYRNSAHFINSVKEARKIEHDHTKFCIFAGACQSYYEAILSEGANFASSPSRVLINALDPSIVAKRISITNYRSIVTPEQISKITFSGSDGIWGINTPGMMKY